MYNTDDIINFLKKDGYEKNFHHGGYILYKIYLLIPKDLDFNGRIRINSKDNFLGYTLNRVVNKDYYDIETLDINMQGYDGYSLVSTPYSFSTLEDGDSDVIPENINKKLEELKKLIIDIKNNNLPYYINIYPYNTISKDIWIPNRLFHIIPSKSKKTLLLRLDNTRKLKGNVIIKKFPNNSSIFPGETLSIKSISSNTIKISLTWTFKNDKLVNEQIPIYNLVRDFVTNLRSSIL